MYLAENSPREKHAEVFGRFGSVSNMGFIVGPIFGGHIAEKQDGFYTVSMLAAFTMVLNVGQCILSHCRGFQTHSIYQSSDPD